MTNLRNTSVTGLSEELNIKIIAAFTGSILISALCFDNQTGLIFAMIWLWVIAAWSVKFDLIHPYTIIGGGMLIYYMASSVLHLADLLPRPLTDPVETLHALLLSMMATFAVLPTKKWRNIEFDANDVEKYYAGAVVVAGVFFAVCAVSTAVPVAMNVGSKEDIVVQGGFISRMSYYSALNVGLSMLALIFMVKQEWRKLSALCIVAMLFFIIILGTAGSRSGIYLFAIAIMLIFSLFRRINIVNIAAFGIVALLLNTVTSGMKQFILTFARGESVVSNIAEYYDTSETNYLLAYESGLSRLVKSSLWAMLGSEPRTVGDNIDRLLESVPQTYPYLEGQAVLGDLQRTFQLGFLVKTGGSEVGQLVSSAAHFNRIVNLDNFLAGQGVGFCLVCTGYLDGGYPGMMLIALALGLGIRVAYGAARKGPLALVFYANFVPIALSSLRQDVSQILSTSLKQLGVPLLIMVLIATFTIKSSD